MVFNQVAGVLIVTFHNVNLQYISAFCNFVLCSTSKSLYGLISNGLFFHSLHWQVDWSARCETPAGSAGQVRPRQRKVIGRLTARPAESEHPGVEINHFQEQQRKTT
jgi:hypothetical protein